MRYASHRFRWLSGLVLLATLGSVATLASADDRDHRDNRGAEHRQFSGPGQRGEHFAGRDDGRSFYDSRWNHDRDYPRRGYVVARPPHGARVIHYRDRPYWYAGGVWYSAFGPSFAVVAPPVGVFVNVLPPFYTTVWFGGIPYYYANDTYYAWREPQHAYQVVEPPQGAAATTVSPATQELFVYPSHGQSPEQTATDRYQCHRWAADQTGFDPTQPAGGVPADQTASLREAYMRAMTACLEGRGYSVK